MLLKVFLRTLLVLPSKCCYNNIIVPCGHSSRRPVTRKRLPSLALGNECGRVARGYCICWRLQRVAGEARNMKENALYFYFFVQLQQTETSDRKLCIFQPGQVRSCHCLGTWNVMIIWNSIWKLITACWKKNNCRLKVWIIFVGGEILIHKDKTGQNMYAKVGVVLWCNCCCYVWSRLGSVFYF